QVGLTVASFDPAYLHQAILALNKQGSAGAFDYLCIHPYEIADGLAEPDGEISYLWMADHLRNMLKTVAPDRANAEIWITEVGQHLGKHGNRTVTEADAANRLIKLYTMALAQGIERIQWFEGRDPAGEEAGFGLLKRDGSPRPAFDAFKTMTA